MLKPSITIQTSKKSILPTFPVVDVVASMLRLPEARSVTAVATAMCMAM